MKTDEIKQLEGRILQCHVDSGDPETFVVGRLLWLFADSFVLNMISPYGRWDGLAMFTLDDLVTVEKGTDYIKMLEKLLILRHEAEPEMPSRMEDGVNTILAYAQNCKEPVALELYKSGHRDVVGYISSLDDGFLQIEQVDELGNSDGTSFVRLCAISRVFCGDDSLTCVKLLSRQSMSQIGSHQ